MGLIFANYNMYLVPFVIVTIVVVTALPRIVPWLFDKVGKRASEPEIKLLFLVLFGLGGLASPGKSEAALPAYLVGMGLAPFFFEGQQELEVRMGSICFAFLIPFYFIKAGSLIEAHALVTGATFIGLFTRIKIATKFFGILPLTRYFKFEPCEGMYTTLMMSTGLTFGSLSALFGLTNYIIDWVHRHRQRDSAYYHSTGLVPAAFRAIGGRCPAHPAWRTKLVDTLTPVEST